MQRQQVILLQCMAQWLSWLERRPVTAKVVGSSPIWVVYGILAQLGEHLPYKQGVTGSSPVGPTRLSKDNQGSRCGGTGRRAGLKILLWQHSTGSIPVTGMFKFFKALGVPDFFWVCLFLCNKKILHNFILHKKFS